MGFADVLEGRLAQVVDIFFLSGCTIKKGYSDAHSGVCLAAIVDRSVPGDAALNECLSLVDSDSEHSEN